MANLQINSGVEHKQQLILFVFLGVIALFGYCLLNCLIAYPIAVGRQGLQRLRVVRHLPVRAEASKPGEAWGQVLDKPPGRKPRGRADEDQQWRGTMGI